MQAGKLKHCSLTEHHVLLNTTTSLLAMALSTISFTDALISRGAEVESAEPSLAVCTVLGKDDAVG